jgi:hypothetical protein
MDQDFARAYLLDRGIPHRVYGTASQVVEYAIARVAAEPTAQNWIDQRAEPIVFVGLDDNAFTWHMSKPPPAGAAVIIFGRGVLSKPGLQAAAVVAHELGHVWLRDHGKAPGGQAEELAADAKAAEWGFKNDLASSLAADVQAEADEKKKGQLQTRLNALRGIAG